MNPEVEVHFKLVGEFEPEAVTSHLGLSPSRTWRAGEPLGTSLVTFETDGWRVTAGPRRTPDAGELVRELLLLLAPISSKLVALRSKMKLKTILTVRIYISPERDDAPDLFVEDDLMQQLATLGAALDIDIMLLLPDESPPTD